MQEAPSACSVSSHFEVQREGWKRAVVQGILRGVVDHNKHVQEAACSALATMEEEAGPQLDPWLPVRPVFCVCSMLGASLSALWPDSNV